MGELNREEAHHVLIFPLAVAFVLPVSVAFSPHASTVDTLNKYRDKDRLQCLEKKLRNQQ